MDSSSAVCSFFSLPSNFVRGHDSVMWDIVWVATHVHGSLSAKIQSLQQAPQCPWFVLKRFRVHHCFLGRPNPGGWIVGSWTKLQLTTEAELQSSRHWEMMSTGSMSDHRGMCNVSRCWGWWRTSLLRGHARCTVALATSPSTAAAQSKWFSMA